MDEIEKLMIHGICKSRLSLKYLNLTYKLYEKNNRYIFLRLILFHVQSNIRYEKKKRLNNIFNLIINPIYIYIFLILLTIFNFNNI